jgi:hypothetical protein
MVFNKYKLLFVGIPKNGSMSVSETIEMVNYLYKYDFELLNYPMLQP